MNLSKRFKIFDNYKNILWKKNKQIKKNWTNVIFDWKKAQKSNLQFNWKVIITTF